MIDLILIDVQRRRNTNYISVGPALTEEETIIFRQFHKPFRAFDIGLLFLPHQFHALHQPHAAHIADDRVFLL